MELQFFNWTTNPDYWDMLNRPIIRTDRQIEKSEFKRTIKRLQRKLKNKHKKHVK